MKKYLHTMPKMPGKEEVSFTCLCSWGITATKNIVITNNVKGTKASTAVGSISSGYVHGT